MSSHYFRFIHRSTVDRRRSPLLERLVARADAPVAVTDWRADAFRVIAAPTTRVPGVAAAALYAERGRVDAASVFLATPVHYMAETSNVRLPADGILSLRRSEALALAGDFNRVWHDSGVRLLTGEGTPQAPAGGGPRMGPTHLFCVFDRSIDAATRDPEEVRDRHLAEYLPTGAAAPRLRRLMSEIEMWLFEHAVNRARIGNALPAVSSLWLWGGGPALSAAPRMNGWAAGDDVFFNALAWRNELPRGPGGNAVARTGAASGVVIVAEQPGTSEWRELESHLLRRSLADLRSGRIARLALSAGQRCFMLSAGWQWRLWRRRRPWWESFA